MTLYIAGAGKLASNSKIDGLETPTNPRIIEDTNITALSTVCYEIRDDNSTPTSSATNGVSYSSGSFDVLNREYPDNTTNGSGGATTAIDYLENLETTNGNRIKTAIYASNGTTLLEGQNVNGINLTTNDYFVILFADDHLKHHVAKITEITLDDIAGDSFNFSPRYSDEIPNSTKYAIYKGPLVSDTSVIAVGYGLEGNLGDIDSSDSALLEEDGTGPVIDVRHGGLTYAARPLFYFYNDRLNKNNELDHNTKYICYYSRSDGSSEVHAKKCFITQQDYAYKTVDYGPYTMNATLTDSLRNSIVEIYSQTVGYSPNYADWDQCFITNKRSDKDLRSGTEAANHSFTGPTRRIHYTNASKSSGLIPEVIDINIYDSINASGTYADIQLLDSRRIYGKKVKRFDKIQINKIIGRGEIGKEFNAVLFGKINGSAGTTTLTVKELEKGQDLRLLLKMDSKYEIILVGDYYYQISGITAPAVPVGELDFEQTLTISGYRKKDEGIFTSGNLPITIVDGIAYRKYWSDVTKTLMVNWDIDTIATYTNIGTSSQTATLSYAGKIITAAECRIHYWEMLLSNNQMGAYTLKIDYGDNTNKYVKLQSDRLQLYQKESLNYPNFLDFYQGGYAIEKPVFTGSVESFEDFIDDSGMFKYKLAGRGNISKLLGPIINKDYSHSNDIVYSTLGPIVNIEATDAYSHSSIRSNIGSTTIEVTGSISGLNVGDLLFNDDGVYLGRIKTLATPLVMEEGLLGSAKASARLYRGKVGINELSLVKALSSNTTIINTVNSLIGTSNKGLYFTSGKNLKDNTISKIPEIEQSPLMGTSSHSNPKALGYHIKAPKSIKPNYDKPFSLLLADELSNPISTKQVHTVNSLAQYNIVNITNKGDTETLIELAPNCSVFLGRMDSNGYDTKLNSFTQTNLVIDSTEHSSGIVAGWNYEIKVNTTSGYADISSLEGKPIYNSSYQYLGNIKKGLRTNSTSTDCWIVLDRPILYPLSSGEKLYSSTNHNHGLYFLNRQGLGGGGNIQLLNHSLSTEDKPVIFDFAFDTDWSGNIEEKSMSTRYGPFNWRFLDLQIISAGGLNYSKIENFSGKRNTVYSRNPGYISGYASCLRFAPGILNASNLVSFGTDNDFAGTTHKMQHSPETRGIYPARGSNFADYTIYPAGKTNTSFDLMPKLADSANYLWDGSSTGPWSLNKINEQLERTGAANSSEKQAIFGYKCNPATHARDSLEIIDPKVTRMFLFSPSDLYPDSMTRENHISYNEKDFSDYNLLLKGKPSTIKSNMKHEKYIGEASYLEELDEMSESIPISSASIKTNELKRFGLMRLIDVTYDWHFNEIDPENPPEKEDLVQPFNYTLYLPVDSTTVTVTGSNYVGSNTYLTVDKDASTYIDDSQNIYSSTGINIGTVASSTYATANMHFDGTITTDEDVEIISTDGTSRTYVAKDANDYPNLQFDKSGNDAATAAAFKGAIEHSSGHGSKISVHIGGDVLILSQTARIGDGNTTNTSTLSNTTVTNFTGGDVSAGQNISGAVGGSVWELKLTSRENFVGAAAYTGLLYEIQRGNALNQSVYKYAISGRGGESTFQKVYEDNSVKPLHMLQTAVFNSNGGGDLTYGFGYGKQDTGEFKASAAVRGLDMYYSGTFSDGPDSRQSSLHLIDDVYIPHNIYNASAENRRLSHMVIPPLFQGFNIIDEPEIQADGYTSALLIRVYQGNTAAANNMIGSASTFTLTVTITDLVGVDTNNWICVSDNFTPVVGNKYYTSNGEFIGKLSGWTQLKVGGTTQNHLYAFEERIKVNLVQGMDIMKGAQSPTSTSYYVTATENVVDDTSPVNLVNGTFSGYHPGGKKSEISLYHPAPTSELIHPSPIIEEFTRGIASNAFWTRTDGLSTATSRHEFQTTTASPWIPTLRQEFYMDGASTVTKGADTLGLIYADMTVVNLNNYFIEQSTSHSLNKGTGWKIERSGLDIIMPKMGCPNLASTKYPYTMYFLRTNTKFASHSLSEESGVRTENQGTDAKGISDGSFAVFKPVFRMPTPTAYYASSNGTVEHAHLRIDVNAEVDNTWLKYATNLTGCYLVSLCGKGFTSGVIGVTTTTKNTNNTIPERIHYVISHTIRRTGSTEYHDLIIDNAASGNVTLNDTYRLMRPAHVCIWKNTPPRIDLYKRSRHYTKQAYSDNMYDEVGHFSYQENEKNIDNIDSEAICSMYVPIIMDDINSNKPHIIPRGTSHNHHTHHFGPNLTYDTYKSYNMLITDGINQHKRNINFESNDFGATIDFSNKLKTKLIGAISLGEIFTIKTAHPVSLRKAKTASIGTSLTIGQESEIIIKELLDIHNIEYSSIENKSGVVIEYPYFIGSKLLGGDLFNTINYIAEVKNKKILFDGDEIKLVTNDNMFRETNIHLTYDNSEIKISELSRNDSAFDLYNEITVYGRLAKSTKRNSRSVKQIGKKTHEEYNNQLLTQSEVDARAKELLKIHSNQEDRITVKIHDNNVELLKVGDIITMEFKLDHIEMDHFIVLQIHQSVSGFMELEVGKYRMGLENRLAELIVENKKVKTILRGDIFKTPKLEENYYESLKIKGIKLIGYKIESSGTQLGFNTHMATDSLFGFGSTTTTEILNEDLL